MDNSAVSSTATSTQAAVQCGSEGAQDLSATVNAAAPGCEQTVSNGVSKAGEITSAKPKQLKTKITERVKRDDEGNIVSRCWDVQVGSALLRVYSTPSGNRELYTVSYWVDGQRKRQVFPSYDKAIAEAKSAGLQLNKGDLGSAELSAVQRVACRRALELLAPTGVPIEVAAGDIARFYLRIGKRATMDQVLDSFDRHNPIGMEKKRVAEVITECLKSKEEDKLSDRYLMQLEYDLNRFAAKFKNYIGDVAGPDIDKWLRDLGVSGRTRNNIRMSVQTLFGFAKAKRYLPKSHDEMDAVPVAKEESGAIEIFTPAELRELLAAASAEMVPFLAIGAFAGVRHAEIQRLDWKNVRFDAGIIEIHAGNAKTATRRTVPILPNLRAWLWKHKEASGPVCSFLNVTDQIVSLLTKINNARAEAAEARNRKGKGRKKAEARKPKTEVKEFKWKHNGLRHSFISYRVADIKNVAQVALEAGNSPQMIFSNYRELVTPKDAETWFRIVPPGTRLKAAGNKVVPMPHQAAA
jgi:integrase